MIKQYKIRLQRENDEHIPQFWAYRLYSWLLTEVPEEVSEYIHSSGAHILSQYLNYGIWTVNLFENESAEIISEILDRADRILLNSDILEVKDRKCAEIPESKCLLAEGRELAGKRITVKFVAPTAFKQNGRYTIYPYEELFVKSLVARWNELIPEYPLQDEDMLEELFKGIFIADYNLRTTRFKLKNVYIPGFTGKIVLECRLPAVLHELWNSVLMLASYAGVGIKTTLGMGGIEIEYS